MCVFALGKSESVALVQLPCKSDKRPKWMGGGAVVLLSSLMVLQSLPCSPPAPPFFDRFLLHKHR